MYFSRIRGVNDVKNNLLLHPFFNENFHRIKLIATSLRSGVCLHCIKIPQRNSTLCTLYNTARLYVQNIRINIVNIKKSTIVDQYFLLALKCAMYFEQPFNISAFMALLISIVHTYIISHSK